MKEFNDFLSKNGISEENTPYSEQRLLLKAFLAGMRSQNERINRLLSQNKSLQMDLEDCLDCVSQMNLMLSAIEEEQEK